MKKILTILVAVLLSVSMFAQSPEMISYQAVVRNSSDALVINTQVGMRISVLQGTESGIEVYSETQTPTSNGNGLISVEIGTGLSTNDFSTIDWSNGSYFIKTEIDLNGGTDYTITGTSQLLSVPYALFANVADSLNGGVNENDPIYDASIASGITAIDTASWNNKLSTELDPVYGASVASGITSEKITSWDSKVSTESDPIYDASIASGITAIDTASWNNKLSTELDPVYGASAASGITSEKITSWDSKLSSEVDGSITNEIQTLSIRNNTISLTDGGSVVLPSVDALPDQTNENGKVLTTNGTSASWGSVAAEINVYGYIYELASFVDAIIVGGADVPFSNNGSLSGITHTAGTTTITVPVSGVYKIDYSVTITSGLGAAIAVAVNGTVDVSSVKSVLTSVGNISGSYMVNLWAGDVVTLRNNSPVPFTLDLAPGVGAQFNIMYLHTLEHD